MRHVHIFVKYRESWKKDVIIFFVTRLVSIFWMDAQSLGVLQLHFISKATNPPVRTVRLSVYVHFLLVLIHEEL